MSDDRFAPAPTSVRVPVTSAWTSKINWTQAVSLLATILALKGFKLDADTQVAIVAGIQSIQAVVTWILRTWFSSTVVAPSVAR